MAKIDNTGFLGADLDHILRHTQGIWEPLRGQRIFITGGTGFFGRWLLESFARANAELDLGATACVLTRNPGAFAAKAPHLAEDPAIQLLAGDFTSFSFPDGPFHSVIHAATALGEPLDIFDGNVNGTRRVLEFARQSGATRFLFTSSGAAYGRQPSELTHIPEEYAGAPDTMDAGTAYGQSKRACEFMAGMYARQYGFAAPIARCFAFSGPYLPLDLNFAIGNFVRDALAGGPIRIGGMGRRGARIFTRPIWRSGCGRFCCGGNPAACTMWVRGMIYRLRNLLKRWRRSLVPEGCPGLRWKLQRNRLPEGLWHDTCLQSAAQVANWD